MKTYKISEHIFPNIIFNQDNILWSYLLSKSINSIHYKSAPNWAWIGKKPKAARNLILVYITGFFYFTSSFEMAERIFCKDFFRLLAFLRYHFYNAMASIHEPGKQMEDE